MSGLVSAMDWCSLPGRKTLISFLLLSTSIAYLQGNPVTGADYNLHCVNDYLYTINCSLSISPSENTAYWLHFIETYDRTEEFVCTLTNINGDYFCSVRKEDQIPHKDTVIVMTFSDLDAYEVLLCHIRHDGSETCDPLDEEYMPFINIKPNPPCSFLVNHIPSKHHFTWRSNCGRSAPLIGLTNNLKYQLQYIKSVDKKKAKPSEINTNTVNYSVDDEHFEPDTEYIARVRSSPNQVHYRGEWSDWSSKIQWKTKPALRSNPEGSNLKVLITVCVMVPVLLLMCCATVKKWKQSALIPTPTPYIHNLHSDCQKDLKAWVITQDGMADMLREEKTLQIDTLIKCADKQEEDCRLKLMESSTYCNIPDPGSVPSLLGNSFALGIMAPVLTSRSSLRSLTFSSQPGSTAEGDSGCWLWSQNTLERAPPFYYNEYCTLRNFQQTGPVTAENQEELPKKDIPL